MAIKHLEIQVDKRTPVEQKDLDEIFIADENLDETSSVSGDATISNYNPLVVNYLNDKYGKTGLNIFTTGKEYIEINPKYRYIVDAFSAYADDGKYITKDKAKTLRSLSIDTSQGEVWDFGDWYDSFEFFYAFNHGFSNRLNLKKFVYHGTKKINLLSQFLGCSNLEEADISREDGEIMISADATVRDPSLYQTFYNCAKLKTINTSTWNTSMVTSMRAAFMNCSSLTSLDLSSFDTSKVTNMLQMFSNCTSLTSVDVSGFDTSSVENMGSAFYNCSALQALDLRSWKATAVTDTSYMFFNSTSLGTLIGGNTGLNEKVLEGLAVNLDLSTNKKLDYPSIRAVINGLATLDEGVSRTLTLGATLLGKLTDDDKKIATDKGWTLT